MADTSVKFFDESFPGAPVLNGTPGAALAVIDACLRTGFGQRQAQSLAVSGGVATVTLANDAKNVNLLHSVIAVSGVTGALATLNGEQRVTAATATTLQFATTAANGTAAGTVSIKTAGVGWTRVYSGLNKAVYKSSDPQSTGKYLRIDDSDAYYTHPRGYGAMTDIDTGTDAFPDPTSFPNNKWRWTRKYGSGDYIWELFADARGFIYAPAIYAGATRPQTSLWFGDTLADYSPAPHECLLTSNGGRTYSSAYSFSLGTTNDWTADRCCFAKRLSGIGAAPPAFARAGGVASSGSGTHSEGGYFPSAGGKLDLCRIALFDKASRGTGELVRRSLLPGVYFISQDLRNSGIKRGDVFQLGGRHLRAVRSPGFGHYDVSDTSYYGKFLVDITGPWR